MADNITLNPGTGGSVVAADEIDGAKYQRVKIVHGAEGVNDGDSAAANPFPMKVQQSVVGHIQTTENLAASATYTSPWLDSSINGQNILIIGKVDQKGKLEIEGSNDQSNIIGSLIQYTDANMFFLHEHRVYPKWCRFKWTNLGSSSTTALAIDGSQSIFPYGNNPCVLEDMTTANLAGNASWTSTWFLSRGQAMSLSIAGMADKDGTITFEVSHDGGVTVATFDTFTYAANTPFDRMRMVNAPYMRIKWTNGNVAQTSFWLHILQRVVGVPDTFGIDEQKNGVSQFGTAPWVCSMAPATSGGLAPWTYIATAVAYTGVIKNSPGQVFGFSMYNNTSAPKYVRLYNMASNPANTDTPVMRIMLPANGGSNIEISNGMAFSTGIGIRCTGGIADNDATALAANDVLLNVLYA